MKPALLIVDVQNDFLPGGALAVPEGDKIIPVINALQKKFDIVLATKDWHPPGHCSFASTYGRKIGEIIQIEGVPQILWPDHCVQNTPGAEFSPLLDTEKIRKVFYKGVDPEIDSYSTFFDNAHKRETGLSDYLHKEHIEEIFIAGLATDYCVKYSVLDARELGFSVTVILEGCRGIDLRPGDIERALKEMRAVGATLVTLCSERASSLFTRG